MFKSLFFLILFTFTLPRAWSKVELRWLSVAAMLLDDGETRILFDPAFTRPTWRHWLTLDKFKSDEALVKQVLQEQKLDRIDAIFICHSHFDHVVDAPMVAKFTGATLYADPNVMRIARAYKTGMKLARMQADETVEVGKFKVTSIKRDHAPLLGIMDFLPGEVPKDFDFGFYDYSVGDTWLYLIEHPQGTIILDNAQDAVISSVKRVRPKLKKIDVLIQGVTRNDDEALLKGYVESFKPHTFVATHFDWFIGEFKPSSMKPLPTIDLEQTAKVMKERKGTMKFIIPEYGKIYELF